MPLAALERFHEQLVESEGRSVSKILEAESAGKFKFCFPVPAELDYSSIIDKITASMGNLINVVMSPYIILKGEYDAMRAEKVTAMTPEGVKKTVADSRLWKRKGKTMRPEYAYAKTAEDEYNTYENRFVKALIDRLLVFLAKPMTEMRGGVKSLYEAHANVGKINKIDLLRLLDPDMFKESDERCFVDFKKIFYLKAKLTQLKSSGFYKIMSRLPAFTDRDPEPTNLLVHNADYFACLKLWLYLNEKDIRMGELKDEGLRAAYSAFVFLYTAKSLTKLGFALKKDSDFRYGHNEFSAHGATFENEYFVVKVAAAEKKMALALTCKVTDEKKMISFGFRVFADDPKIDTQYIISFAPTSYSDETLRVQPDSSSSLKDLETLLHSIFFIVKVEQNVYDKLCLVCGSNAVEEKKEEMRCLDCGSEYSFFDKETVWLKKFRVHNIQIERN